MHFKSIQKGTLFTSMGFIFIKLTDKDMYGLSQRRIYEVNENEVVEEFTFTLSKEEVECVIFDLVNLDVNTKRA